MINLQKEIQKINPQKPGDLWKGLWKNKEGVCEILDDILKTGDSSGRIFSNTIQVRNSYIRDQINTLSDYDHELLNEILKFTHGLRGIFPPFSISQFRGGV